MKNYICKISSFFILALITLSFNACEISDTNKDYGFPTIYIPQATVTGLDNSYPIPNGPFGQNSSYTCNYKDDNLNIALGVVRAGYIADQKAFTVDLGISQSETQRKLTELEQKGIPAVVIPSELCTIPSKINVENGKNTGTCYVSLNLKELAKQNSSLFLNGVYKLLVLGLEISNPTYYDLSETNTSVVIVLDLNSSYWDEVAENLPESEVRYLFPLL